MSTRLVPPPPVARWPFFVGAVFFDLIAVFALLAGDVPPGIGALIIAVVCVGAAAGLVFWPFLVDNEARLRVAEAAARDMVETQLRRLSQTTEQLAHAVSRSQSTEEQAGQALGTLEELSEKLTAQADELAQNLARSHEREHAALRAELERVNRERDDRLAMLDKRIEELAANVAESQSASRRALTAATKALDELKERVAALTAWLDENHASPKPAANAPTPAPESPPDSSVAAPEPGPAHPPEPPEPPSTPAPPVAPIVAAPRPPRARRAADTDGSSAPKVPAPRPTTLELPLEGGAAGHPTAAPTASTRRENGAGSTSLVATAYIGIGNKLFVRGEGPGLSWDRGAPMQFLAIGKWGWTTTEASGPITCRIYRNDDTPMLDENIVIAPGAKAEITPRF